MDDRHADPSYTFGVVKLSKKRKYELRMLRFCESSQSFYHASEGQKSREYSISKVSGFEIDPANPTHLIVVLEKKKLLDYFSWSKSDIEEITQCLSCLQRGARFSDTICWPKTCYKEGLVEEKDDRIWKTKYLSVQGWKVYLYPKGSEPTRDFPLNVISLTDADIVHDENKRTFSIVCQAVKFTFRVETVATLNRWVDAMNVGIAATKKRAKLSDTVKRSPLLGVTQLKRQGSRLEPPPPSFQPPSEEEEFERMVEVRRARTRSMSQSGHGGNALQHATKLARDGSVMYQERIWIAAFDGLSRKSYYFNPYTEATSWELPRDALLAEAEDYDFCSVDDEANDDELELVVPNAVVREAAEERQANSERNETLQEENPSRVDTNSHKVIPVAEHETKGGEEVDSLQRVISKEAAERAKQNKKDSLGDCVNAADRLREAISREKASMGNLPVGWQPAVDSITGSVYYYNGSTGETTWQRPIHQEGKLSAREFLSLLRGVFVEAFRSIENVFRMTDQDRSGRIDYQELRDLLVSIDKSITEDHVQLLLSTIDRDSNGQIEFEEFLDAFQGQPTANGIDAFTRSKTMELVANDVQMSLLREVQWKVQPLIYRAHCRQVRRKVLDNDKSIREVFMDFDKNKDGVVTHEEFKEGIRSLGISMSAIQSRLLMSALDKGKNSSDGDLERKWLGAKTFQMKMAL